MLTDGRVDEASNRAQVRTINGLYNHFMIYVSVIGVLVAINLALGGAFWVHWVILGWGLGIILHAYLAFIVKPARMAEARARAVETARQSASENPPSPV